ncbi:alpha/beta hydrolase fold domain-containing protein [bacterium]|nr:alpha/beta hydrolase fold domain-containing protein [bacterium]
MASAELQMVIDLLRGQPIPRDASFVEQRAAMENLTALAPPPEGVTCTPCEVGGRPAEWVGAAGADPQRALLYLHGGGYCIGSINSHRLLAADLSRAAGVRALLLDYRLAPEHPFPAAVEDAVAAYRFLLDAGFDRRRLAIAGDSAGGGLAAATLLALRDRDVPLPAAAALLSPWLDLSQSGESMTSRAALDPMVQRDGLQRMADAYLAGADPRTPLASPLFADLRHLPPLLLHVGGAETLLDDARRFAARASAAGVDATLEVWDDMIHVWHAFGLLPEARAAQARIGEFLRRHLG